MALKPVGIEDDGSFVGRAREWLDGRFDNLVILDVDHASLEDALAVVPPGGVLEIQKAHTRATAFVVDKPCTVRRSHVGKITTTVNSVAAVEVTADDVTLERLHLEGTGGDTSALGDAIRVRGTAAAPIKNLRILGPRIDEFSKHAILLEHVHDFEVTGVRIDRCGYAGIMTLSAIGGSIHGGSITNILQPTGFANSYGVAISRVSTGSISSIAPRSRDIKVEDVTVDGVPNWEGMDTHAGENITFKGNRIYNCRTGIAIIGSKDETGVGTIYAPINCKAIENTLRSGKTDGTAGVGIVFAGAADTLGAPTELATGWVIDNTIQDYGAQNTSSGCSIQVFGTVGVKVNGNTIINSGFSGIDFYHDNYSARADGNVIVDVWSDSASSSYAVQFRASYNEVTLANTQLVRSGKTAVKVNDRGLNISAFATNLWIDGGNNQFHKATTLAVAGDITTSESRVLAKKLGFYGVPPVARAAAVTLPGAAPAAYTQAWGAQVVAAVTASVTAQKNLGLTS